MKPLSCLAANLLLAAAPVFAQAPAPADTTFQGLGGKPGIEKIVATFVPIILADQIGRAHV